MNHSTFIVILLVLFTTNKYANAGKENNRPIIGVLTVPLDVGGCVTYASMIESTKDGVAPTSCFHNLYVQWIESAGARVVPIPYNKPINEIDDILIGLNGILFTGGDVVLQNLTSTYMKTAKYLLDQVKKINDNGEYFPLWGTCMGIQTISVLVAEDPSVLSLNKFDSENLMLPLNFTIHAAKSKLFNLENYPMPMKSEIYNWFQNNPVTTNLHHDGLHPNTFVTNINLNNFFHILSTNRGRKGNQFVSTIEGIKYPVFATQWHPERPQFEWGTDGTTTDPINHDFYAISCSQYVSNFYINEARKNNRKYKTIEEEGTRLIYNYKVTGDTYYQVYLF